MNEPQAPRARTSFAKLDQPLPLPNLIDIQKKSWEWFLSDGLAETIADINPIKDYSEKLLVQFGEHQFGEPIKSITECRNTDSTFSAPLNMKVAFINEETGEIREQSVFMGDFPMMTERGTFIIHGTERVVVTQLVRSPGAYIMEPKQAEREKQVLVANLMPQRGSWLELEIDKKGAVNVRIDRKRKFPVTVLLRAMGYGADDELLALFDDSVYIRNTIERDVTRSQDEALIELFRKQRPGEPPTLDGATAMLKGLFFDPKRYDLSRVGRHKLNVRLYTHLKPEDRPDADVRVLVNEDIVELIRRLISLPVSLGVPDDAKDYAAEANALLATRREEIASEIDEYEHFGNRRLRTVGELVQDAFRIGLARMERVIRERLTTEDPDTIVPATLVNIRPVVAALKEFFGSSQLSQFMDQTNPL
ncbi:MAG TPA: DNA-directed RNA polymerase subunit beta, partial [Thermoleophilia bacterium]|nr:DNA-directed RNA polymerase subunit beta [Thermoleophilia bacterium]